MRKILLSILTIGLVASVAFGATRAYFSDTATSEGNTFSAGTMDFRIARPGTSDHKIFNVSNLEPGETVSGYFVVVNDSTEGLDMKWKAWIPDFSDGILDDVLEAQITIRPAGYGEYAAFQAAGYTIAGPADTIINPWTHIHNLGTGNNILVWDEVNTGTDDPFKVKWAAVYKIEVKMKETAGNAYQGASFTGNINFYATQNENSGW